MELLQNRKLLMTNNSTKWDNTQGCSDQYICATPLYLLSMFYHSYKILIDCGVGAPGQRKYFVNGLNAILVKTVQLPSAATTNSQMVVHTSMSNTYIIPLREFQKNVSDPTLAHGLIGQVKYRKQYSKRKWTECEYYVQCRKYVQHKQVQMSCA